MLRSVRVCVFFCVASFSVWLRKGKEKGGKSYHSCFKYECCNVETLGMCDPGEGSSGPAHLGPVGTKEVVEDTSCWRGAQEEEEWGARNCLGSKNMTHTSCKTFQGPPTLPGEGQRVTRDLQILIRKHNHNNKGISCVAPPPPGEVRLTPQVGLSDLFQVPSRQLLASLLGAARRRFVAQRREPFFPHRTPHRPQRPRERK